MCVCVCVCVANTRQTIMATKKKSELKILAQLQMYTLFKLEQCYNKVCPSQVGTKIESVLVLHKNWEVI